MLLTFPVLTELDRWFSRNAYRFRQGMLDILRIRAKSIVSGDHSIEEGDLFTCMLNFDGYRDDWEAIVDDVTTMIFAGSHTQQITTSNMMWYLDMKPELKKKCHAEVDKLLGSCEPDILKNYDYEKSMELEYLPMCFQESMRIEVPAGISTEQAFLEDCKVGNVTIKKGDRVYFGIDPIHYDID
jgi:cytochrome P450